MTAMTDEHHIDIISSCHTVQKQLHKWILHIIRTTSEQKDILTTFDYIILMFHLITIDRCQVLRVKLNKQCLSSGMEREVL